MNNSDSNSNNNNALVPSLYNRPGLSTIAYRIGDYEAFRQRLISRLALRLKPEIATLASLTTREQDDAAIALIDAWSVVADVLTFYQERIANEGYLSTATERLSVLELTRAIGYKLSPGGAASTYLAFEVENTPDGAEQITEPVLVPSGTGVMSVPIDPEDLPQTFETSEDLLAQAAWNRLSPRLAKPQVLTRYAAEYLEWQLAIDGEIATDDQPIYLYLQGTNTQLKPGDFLLVVEATVPKETGLLLTIETVEPIAEANHTKVSWYASAIYPLAQAVAQTEMFTYVNPQVFAFRQKAALFGHNAPIWKDYGHLVERGIFYLEDPTVVAADTEADTEDRWVRYSQSGELPADITCLAATNQYLFAGTAGAGIFRRALDNTTPQWVSVSNGLINPAAALASLQVRSLKVDSQNYVYAGTAGGGLFRSKNHGDSWLSLPAPDPSDAQTSRLLDKVVQAIEVDEATKLIFVGTDNGIFRFREGQTPVALNRLRGKSVFSLAKVFLSGRTQIIAGTSEGVYVLGNLSMIRRGSFGTRIWNWLHPEPFRAASGPPIYSLSTYTANGKIFLFAGSQGRLYRSEDLAQPWEIIDISIPSAEIGDIHSISVESGPGADQYTLLCGTAAGVVISTDSGSSWQLVSKDAGETTSLLRHPSDSSRIYIGTRLSRFDQSEWDDFEIPVPDIDLDRPYPQVLPESWIVLLQNKQVSAYQAQDVVERSRTDFGLTGQITRIVTNATSKTPDLDFDLRNATVLIESAQLHLAPRPLTVETRQHQIFSDPVNANEIFLNSYVTGLEAGQPLIASGKRINLEVSDIGGVFQAQLQSSSRSQSVVATDFNSQWQPVNAHLLNQEVQVFAFYTPYSTDVYSADVYTSDEPTLLFVGTRAGVFQLDLFSDYPQKWQLIENESLTSTHIEALVAFPHNEQPRLVAGTPAGIFVRDSWDSTEAQTWRAADLSDQQIQVIVHCTPENTSEDSQDDRQSYLLAGTRSGLFRSHDGGETWTPSGLDAINVQTLTTHGRFIYAGSADAGIFLSIQAGLSWQSISINQPLSTPVQLQGRSIKGLPPTLIESLSVSQLRLKTSDNFLISSPVSLTQIQPALTSITIAGRNIELFVSEEETLEGPTTTTVELAEAVSVENTAETISAINNGLTNQNVTALAVSADERVLAGTAGSGIFYSDNGGQTWQPLLSQPGDLHIRDLAVHGSRDLWLAGTATGGAFISHDQGTSWQSFTTGLDSVGIRAVAIAPQSPIQSSAEFSESFPVEATRLWAGGIGIVRSPDNLEQIEVRTGDRFALLSPPDPPKQQSSANRHSSLVGA